MAKIVTKKQPIIAGVTNPGSVYSRIVTASYSEPQPFDKNFCCTLGLAQTLWLKKVHIWISSDKYGAFTQWWFSVRRGFRDLQTLTEFWTWEDLLPVRYVAGMGIWNGFDQPVHIELSMNRLLTGQGQRFAASHNITKTALSYMTVSFEISEG